MKRFGIFAVALLVSCYVQSTDAAVRVTYAIVFAMSFLSLAPNYLYQGQAGRLPTVSVWLRQLSPVPVLMRIVGHGDFGSQGLLNTEGSGRFFLMGVLTTLGFVIIAMPSASWMSCRSDSASTD